MTLRPLTVLGTAFLFSTLAFDVHADVRLEMKFHSGETIRQVMTQKMKQEMTVPGQPQIIINMTQIMDMELKVDKVRDDGIAEVRQRISRARMTMDVPLPTKQTIEVDTDGEAPANPTGQMLANTMKAITAGEFLLKINSSGEASDIVIPKEILEATKQNPALAQMGQMFSEDGLKQMTKMGQVSFPAKSLKSGDSWEEAQELPTPLGKMKTTRKYTYLGPVDGLEKIGVEASVTLDLNPNSPVKVKFKPNKGKGEMLFDNKLGRMTKSNVSVVLETEIEAGPQKILQKVTNETDVKLVTESKSKN